ncbi:hypothetical protein BCR33DRAFT_343858 [Rhizoclosmatium globosum]|uniref:Pal1-domain-containing protein n=1 Tax=Rhizoclosmatium globosum TaxID=329046 RepID=A0A1Y2C2P3_9FUNG|nr:hypothetical protein BCR33DRAFT_343858 [Rhizoclosmatium globosum]|eukprot:ORY41300.1 hypothetical protein BCR33DRAFT_343858 [Rhizoclosmatium globosum]
MLHQPNHRHRHLKTLLSSRSSFRERSSQYIPGTGSMSPLETRRVNSEYYGVSPLAGSSGFEFPLPPSSSGDELNQGMRGMTLNRPGPSTNVRNQRTYSLSTIQSNQPQYPGAPTSPTGTSMHHPDSVHSSQQGSELNSAYTFPPQQFQFPPPGAAAYAESIGSDESITYEGVGEAQKVKRNKSSKKSGLKEEVATNIFFGPPTKLNYNRRKSEGPVEKKKSADSDEKGNGGLFAKFHRKKNRASSPSSMDKSDTSSAGGSVYLPPEHQQQQYFAPTDIPVTVPEALIQRTSGQMSRQPDIAPVHPLLADAVPVAYKPITPGLRRSKSFSAGRPSTSGDKTDEEGEEGGQLAKFRARRAAEKARLAAGQQGQ